MAKREFTPSPGKFKLESTFEPRGDQPTAIAGLIESVNAKNTYQTLLGITGSGKTYTIAKVIESVNRPALIIAPNKTLAAQLYNEFREFFPSNNVHYFVSYYDYYQPEAYLPTSDTYIEKDSSINQEIDKLRHAATRAILESRDTIIVASVSCIYGLGAPEEYFNLMLFVEDGDQVERDQIVQQLVYMQYQRSDLEFKRGTFRVRGDVIDVFPGDQDTLAIRIELFGDEVESLSYIDPLTSKFLKKVKKVAVYPLSHFLTSQESVKKAIVAIKDELNAWLPVFRARGKGFEAERIKQRTLYDLELFQEVGFCPGVENYSRHLAGRDAGESPTTLIDYFPDDFLVIIDESHVTVPQIGGMFAGDRARKTNLVEYGFRLPSALDNRPLNSDEFWDRAKQVIFVSATPGDRELERSQGKTFAQINRPTGLLDPEISIRPAKNQIDDLTHEIRLTIERGERVIVTTLTKKMAEDLATYFREIDINCRYLHSDVKTIERVEIIRGLRKGDFDVLIGINLLREGLDLVEVSLVAILDADKEGFLRSERSLIQTVGRAARNLNGRAILYADKMTGSIQATLDETNRRRLIQAKYNLENNITPVSAKSSVDASIFESLADLSDLVNDHQELPKDPKEILKLINLQREKMFQFAAKKEFEEAAKVRDLIFKLEELLLIAE